MAEENGREFFALPNLPSYAEFVRCSIPAKRPLILAIDMVLRLRWAGIFSGSVG